VLKEGTDIKLRFAAFVRSKTRRKATGMIIYIRSARMACKAGGLHMRLEGLMADHDRWYPRRDGGQEAEVEIKVGAPMAAT
jgi:hypothetical protein